MGNICSLDSCDKLLRMLYAIQMNKICIALVIIENCFQYYHLGDCVVHTDSMWNLDANGKLLRFLCSLIYCGKFLGIFFSSRNDV